jgi:hypothetical protein
VNGQLFTIIPRVSMVAQVKLSALALQFPDEFAKATRNMGSIYRSRMRSQFKRGQGVRRLHSATIALRRAQRTPDTSRAFGGHLSDFIMYHSNRGTGNTTIGWFYTSLGSARGSPKVAVLSELWQRPEDRPREKWERQHFHILANRLKKRGGSPRAIESVMGAHSKPSRPFVEDFATRSQDDIYNFVKQRVMAYLRRGR